MGYYNYWSKYVSAAERKKKAQKHVEASKKKGKQLNPVKIEGRTIAKTFWGKAWCENLESYSDFSNRLPRGRTYVRNGSVIDLHVTKGQVKAQVMGSSLYHVTVKVEPLPESKWKAVVKACSGKIDSLIELLQGKFSKAVMEIMTQRDEGLFPKPREISMQCSCPDYAGMCKHIAAVLYGVGAILDVKPDWLFELRHVDHLELIATAGSSSILGQNQKSEVLEESELSALFGIEMETDKIAQASEPPTVKKAKEKSPKKLSIKENKKIKETNGGKKILRQSKKTAKDSPKKKRTKLRRLTRL